VSVHSEHEGEGSGILPINCRCTLFLLLASVDVYQSLELLPINEEFIIY
jgi:hypothetical protein